jgi:hypothetical protein
LEYIKGKGFLASCVVAMLGVIAQINGSYRSMLDVFDLLCPLGIRMGAPARGRRISESGPDTGYRQNRLAP